MKTRKLRDIEVSAVGMGCMAFSHGYGKIPSEEYSIEAIQNAYKHGRSFHGETLRGICQSLKY